MRNEPSVLSSLRRRRAELDRAAVRRLARVDSPVLLDQLLPRLSRLADHGVLWGAVAAGLWATGDQRARRAAWRGLGSVAVASATANVIGKGLNSRHRPDADIPAVRRLPHPPTSASFPSGHAASAAAFATAVTLEAPVLAPPIIVLAGAVGLSRVVTGVHYPSDVLAGFAIGAGAGTVVHLWLGPAVSRRLHPRRASPGAAAGPSS
jgi:membrane-associated phospholipid phosphatase